MACANIEEVTNLFSQLNIEKSIRGGKLLIHKNFIFKIDRTNKNGKTFWCCNESSTCRARVSTNNFSPPVEEINIQHDHAARPARIEVLSAINKMKEVSSNNENRQTRLIVQENQAKISDEAAALLPTYDALRQRLLNVRVECLQKNSRSSTQNKQQCRRMALWYFIYAYPSKDESYFANNR